MTHKKFATWADVIAHVEAGETIYYQAALDPRPVAIKARVLRGKFVRVTPYNSSVDPFTAEEDRLSFLSFLSFVGKD